MDTYFHEVLATVKTSGGFEEFNMRTPLKVASFIKQLASKNPSFQELLTVTAAALYEDGYIDSDDIDEEFLSYVSSELLRSWYDAQDATRRALKPSDLSVSETIMMFSQGVPPGEFGFPEKTRAVRLALESLARLASLSELNTRESFDPDSSGRDREGSSKFETWLVEEVLPTLRDEGLEHVNSELRSAFSAFHFEVKLSEIPTAVRRESSDGSRSWFDVRICMEVTSAYGKYMFAEPVNIKYVRMSNEEESFSDKSNTGGAGAFRYAMLGLEDKTQRKISERVTESTEAERLVEIFQSVSVTDENSYAIRNCDYWFWAFEKRREGAPIERSQVSSFLCTDPLGVGGRSPMTYNSAQSFPSIQINFDLAGSGGMSVTHTALEARDRFLQWWVPKVAAPAQSVVSVCQKHL